GLLAGQHVEEVRSQAEILARRDRILALAQPVDRGRERDDLPRQTDRLPLVRLRRHVLRLGIAVGESRYRRAQRGHRMRLRRRGAYDAEDTLVDPRTVHELRAEPVERGAIGQLTVPEEVADLFERGVAREVVD